MGSGTTIGEAVKLGMRGIGRDINHVAYFAVRNALAQHDRGKIVAAFEDIEQDVSRQIQQYYSAHLNDRDRVRRPLLFFGQVRSMS